MPPCRNFSRHQSKILTNKLFIYTHSALWRTNGCQLKNHLVEEFCDRITVSFSPVVMVDQHEVLSDTTELTNTAYLVYPSRIQTIDPWVHPFCNHLLILDWAKFVRKQLRWPLLTFFFLYLFPLGYFSPRRGCPRFLKFCKGFNSYVAKNFRRCW